MAYGVDVSAYGAPWPQAERSAPLTFRSRVRVGDTRVRLEDVADLSGLPVPLAQASRRVVVAEVRPGRATRVSTAEAFRRARAATPALAAWLAPAGPDWILVEAAKSAAPPREGRGLACVRLTAFIPRGAPVLADRMAPAPCDGARPGLMGYEGSLGVAIARTDLRPGTVTQPPPASALAAARAGDRLELRLQVGPVRIARQVAVLRPAAIGRPLVVRGEHGGAFIAEAEVRP